MHRVHLHKRVVKQRPSSWSLERVVDEGLDPSRPDIIPLHRTRVAQGRLGEQTDVLWAPFEVRFPDRTDEKQRAVPFLPRALLQVSGQRALPLAWILGGVSGISGPDPHVHCSRASAPRVWKSGMGRMPWSGQGKRELLSCRGSFKDLVQGGRREDELWIEKKHSSLSNAHTNTWLNSSRLYHDCSLHTSVYSDSQPGSSKWIKNTQLECDPIPEGMTLTSRLILGIKYFY